MTSGKVIRQDLKLASSAENARNMFGGTRCESENSQ